MATAVLADGPHRQRDDPDAHRHGHVGGTVPLDAPPAAPPAPADPSGPTAAALADVDDCTSLHTAVLSWLDRAAERARSLHPDRHAIELLVSNLMVGEIPQGLEAFDGIPRNRFPGSPSCPNTFPDIDG